MKLRFVASAESLALEYPIGLNEGAGAYKKSVIALGHKVVTKNPQ